MKPDWKDAPEWANWLAMDGDGRWNWYNCEPIWDSELQIWVLSDEDNGIFEDASDGPDCSGIDWDSAWSEKESRP